MRDADQVIGLGEEDPQFVPDADGDGVADLLAFYENPDTDTVFAAIDGGGLGSPVELARVPDGSYLAGGFGPDVLGTGAPSLWAAASHDSARPTFEMLFARLR